jgi:hypothetical protein
MEVKIRVDKKNKCSSMQQENRCRRREYIPPIFPACLPVMRYDEAGLLVIRPMMARTEGSLAAALRRESSRRASLCLFWIVCVWVYLSMSESE